MIDTFMFCDVRRYELSVRGSMRGESATPLVAAIDHLPDECVASIDLRELDDIDLAAVRLLRAAVEGREACGVDISIDACGAIAMAALERGGLARLVRTIALPHAS